MTDAVFSANKVTGTGTKEDFVDTFANNILPFRDEEVEHVVMGEKRRDFNVYCIIDT